MRLFPTEPFLRYYNRLPAEVQGQVDQSLQRLLLNPRHPSLRMKKMQGRVGIWELRVTRSYRVTFQIEGDTYILRAVGTHDILRNP